MNFVGDSVRKKKKICIMQLHEHLKLKMGIPVVYSANIYRLFEDNIEVYSLEFPMVDVIYCVAYLVMKMLELFFLNFAVDQDQNQTFITFHSVSNTFSMFSNGM